MFFEDTPQGDKVVDYAASLAQRFGAHLVGIHSIAAVQGEYAVDSFVRGEQAIHSAITRRRTAEERQAHAVAERFASLASKYDVGAEFRVILNTNGGDEALVNSLHCDLVVLGHPKAQGLPAGWTAQRLLMASGVPILIIPDGSDVALIGGKVIVAWNGSREARRAIADAMPILTAARSVTVLVVDAAKTPQKYGEDPGADIATHLARHGIHVDLEQAVSEGAPIAEVIGSRAVEQGASLIVIGAYSHSRSAEMIFGGVTRALMALMPVPVLVSR